MTTIDQFPLTLAQQTFAVANTPLFLIRKLRVDPDVHEISRAFDGIQLLAELERSLQSKPENLRQSVLPYVLLMSLFFKGDKSFLTASGTVARNYEDDWFEYVRQVLIQTYRTTQFTTLKAQQPTSTLIPAHPKSASATSAPTSAVILKASP